MVDPATNKPVQVTLDPLAGPYIKLSLKHLEAVQQVLAQNAVQYWTNHIAVSFDGGPMIATIYVDKKANADEVQKILDRAE